MFHQELSPPPGGARSTSALQTDFGFMATRASGPDCKATLIECGPRKGPSRSRRKKRVSMMIQRKAVYNGRKKQDSKKGAEVKLEIRGAGEGRAEQRLS